MLLAENWREKMVDFDENKFGKCNICGEIYPRPKGKICDCWECSECGEEFSDYDMLANRELWLCLYCQDERYQAEV